MSKILGIIVCWVLRWCTPDLQKLPMYRLSRIVEVGDRGWRMDFSYHSMGYSNTSHLIIPQCLGS